MQLRSARGRNAPPAVGPRPFQIETLVEQQLFRTLREGKRTSFPSASWNETFIFARRAVSKKGNFSGKVYPVHVPIFVTRRAVGYWIRDLQRRCDACARDARHRSSTPSIHKLEEARQISGASPPSLTPRRRGGRHARRSHRRARARRSRARGLTPSSSRVSVRREPSSARRSRGISGARSAGDGTPSRVEGGASRAVGLALARRSRWRRERVIRRRWSASRA